MSRFHNILVAVDFSPTSDDAVATAADLSRSCRAPLHLLHVVSNVQVPFAIEPVDFDFAGHVRESIATARETLATLAAGCGIEPGLLTAAVVNGAPAAEIVRYAQEHAIDVIVMGAHGHGFLDRLLVGSVAERVARRAPCAVLLVPHATARPTAVDAKAVAGVDG
jgi:nucleotide-binding universal stress UspA family protein